MHFLNEFNSSWQAWKTFKIEQTRKEKEDGKGTFFMSVLSAGSFAITV